MAHIPHSYPGNVVEGVSEKEGLLDVYCTSLELVSAVLCYELVLDVSPWIFKRLTHEFTLFLAFPTPAQVYYPN